MFKFIKRLFCKHDDEIVKKVEPFCNISGMQTYKRCKKCGRIKKIFLWSMKEMVGSR